MKSFEISSKKYKTGRRKFKMILHQIYPDECVENETGTVYNRNGITWIREYCERALPSIVGMSLRVEFANQERTEIIGHGMTDEVDDEPIFEDATMIGKFTKGYIDEVEVDGENILACIGEGEIDSQCYHNFVTKLDEDIANGIYPDGSIEIMHTEDNPAILYQYGYKDKGRIPMDFIYSGFCLIGVTPADDTSKLVELNSKEEEHKMDENEIKSLVEQAVADCMNHTAEINQIKEECGKQVETVTNEKNEAIANSEKLQAALDAVKAELEEAYKKIDTLYEEASALREELGKAKAAERVGELNSAIAKFTDEEKAYAKAEIDAFNADPVSAEINSVVNKIYEGIGMAAKAAQKQEVPAVETNAANIDDIFGYVADVGKPEDTNIF